MRQPGQQHTAAPYFLSILTTRGNHQSPREAPDCPGFVPLPGQEHERMATSRDSPRVEIRVSLPMRRLFLIGFIRAAW